MSIMPGDLDPCIPLVTGLLTCLLNFVLSEKNVDA